MKALKWVIYNRIHVPIYFLCTYILYIFSAGVGRTGVFITLSIVLERMRYEGVVDMYQTVKMLRTQRPAMVQTEVNNNYVSSINFFIWSLWVLKQLGTMALPQTTWRYWKQLELFAHNTVFICSQYWFKLLQWFVIAIHLIMLFLILWVSHFSCFLYS